MAGLPLPAAAIVTLAALRLSTIPKLLPRKFGKWPVARNGPKPAARIVPDFKVPLLFQKNKCGTPVTVDLSGQPSRQKGK
ncbi:hypothetical protein GCM10011371_29030 [Novosphingobium marinum]|nr:hypothetical protein GCM10011371_29030 [Novosphingobium marinum]